MNVQQNRYIGSSIDNTIIISLQLNMTVTEVNQKWIKQIKLFQSKQF